VACAAVFLLLPRLRYPRPVEAGAIAMQAVKDASGLYEVERRAYHAARPGFRIAELQISPTQQVPWHYHNNVHDTFYVIEGAIRIFMQDPKESVELNRGQTYAVPPKRPHLVTNAGETSATFLVLQGIGEYDFVPMTRRGKAFEEKPSEE
jgi:mannose-6-phosphate isomerase-like protein (cupin superfamily)